MRTFKEMLHELGAIKEDPDAARAWQAALSEEERGLFAKELGEMLAVGLLALEKALAPLQERVIESVGEFSEAFQPILEEMENSGLRAKVEEYAQLSRDAGF